MPYGGGLAFPGDQLLRLSMDLATGTAGVLLALGTVLHDQPVPFPFFATPRTRMPRSVRVTNRKEVYNTWHFSTCRVWRLPAAGGGGAGSTLTVLGCGSEPPSNLSLRSATDQR